MKPITLLALVFTLLPAQERPRFSTNVQLVMVDAQVTEKNTGKILELLSPNDFEVYEDGRRCEIREFQFETTPLDVVFLTYAKSGWGPAKDINDFRRGLNLAPAELRATDRGAVLRTDSASKVDLQMTDDLEKVRHALVFGTPHIPTGHDHLYDATRVATTLFPRPKDRTRRRSILAITDDIERGSKCTLAQLITELLEADATLHVVNVVLGKQGAREIGIGGGRIPRIGREIGRARTGGTLRDAVEATGGEAIPGDLFQERLPELIRRMRLRYLFGFYASPTRQREYRTIDVRLSPEARKRYPNALVRARRGYYAAPAGSGVD
ncbi:VWA domain-containing protein [uncultured Paludibaculum sp.]|uniref:VWA domain-containing protein n=1 Tax=uncultured Paludibaculum sp. TaxID=1765020 RepID=UPI002AAAF0BE|nr:VWA domain-containing protein [uncultured Paludibaculum sp.]